DHRYSSLAGKGFALPILSSVVGIKRKRPAARDRIAAKRRRSNDWGEIKGREAERLRGLPLQSSPTASSRPERSGLAECGLEGSAAGMGHSVEVNGRFRKSEGEIHLRWRA